jgi:hypothetical protein
MVEHCQLSACWYGKFLKNLEEIVSAIRYRPVSPPTIKERALVARGMKADGHPLIAVEHLFNMAYSVAFVVITQLTERELSV